MPEPPDKPGSLFEFFDPDQPIAICRRRLPHWFQPDRTYFITFRTADSFLRTSCNGGSRNETLG